MLLSFALNFLSFFVGFLLILLSFQIVSFFLRVFFFNFSLQAKGIYIRMNLSAFAVFSLIFFCSFLQLFLNCWISNIIVSVFGRVSRFYFCNIAMSESFEITFS